MLRLLVGNETPDKGSAGIVGQNVVMNYFEQNQADALDLDKTVVETIQGASSNQSYNELRALLGQFLFKGDAVEKKVSNLSGGEKARLSLCCMMLKPANLLILDEPYVYRIVLFFIAHFPTLQYESLGYSGKRNVGRGVATLRRIRHCCVPRSFLH